MSLFLRFAVVTIFVSALAACSSGDRVQLPDHASVHEDLRLDATENFSRLGRILVGTRGEIIVPEPQDARIRIYDSSGARINTFGRLGDAPGEFRRIGLTGLKADTIWVSEPQSRRFSLFAPDGSFLRTERMPGGLGDATPFEPVGGFAFVMILGLHPDGSLLAAGRRFTTVGTEREIGNEEVLHVTDLGEVRTVGTQPSYEDPRWMMQVSGLGRGIPFAAGPIVAISSDGERFANVVTDVTSREGGSYTVTVLRANGDTLFVKAFAFAGVPIPQSARDSAADAEISATGATEGPANVDQKFRNLARENMPPVYPPIEMVRLGIDETVWITLRDSAGVRPTVVLDATGEIIGRVELPTNTRIQQAMSTRIWVLEVDSLDLASVVRFRVLGLGYRVLGLGYRVLGLGYRGVAHKVP